MRDIKLLIHVILIIFITCMAVWLIQGAFKSYEALPYKMAFKEYQRAAYLEYTLIYYQKQEKDGKITIQTPISELNKMADSLSFNEQAKYNNAVDSLSEYEDLKLGIEKIHQAIQILREIRDNDFKNVNKEENVCAKFYVVLDSVIDKHYDCSIIPKYESKRMGM